MMDIKLVEVARTIAAQTGRAMPPNAYQALWRAIACGRLPATRPATMARGWQIAERDLPLAAEILLGPEAAAALQPAAPAA
jgi:hypothetical protein